MMFPKGMESSQPEKVDKQYGITREFGTVRGALGGEWLFSLPCRHRNRR